MLLMMTRISHFPINFSPSYNRKGMLKITLFVLAALFFYGLFYSSVLDRSYSDRLVRLYATPAWRFALLIFTIVSFMWYAPLGIFFGLILVFYFADVGLFSTVRPAEKWPVTIGING
jgi:hypothetical protein